MCSVISSQGADFLNCRLLCLLVLNMSGYFFFPTESTSSFVWGKKVQKALTLWHRCSGLLVVYSGKWTVSDLKFGGREGGFGSVLLR